MTRSALMADIASEIALRVGIHTRVRSTPTGYCVAWPGVTIQLDPDIQRAIIHRPSGMTDVSLRRLSVDGAATIILDHCKES